MIGGFIEPGVIKTKLLHAGWGGGGVSTEAGARTSIFVATNYTLAGRSGLYFVNSEERKSSAMSYDQRVQDRLWEISLKLAGMQNFSI